MASRTVFLSAILSVAAVIHVGATEYFVDANRLDTEAVIDGLSRATAFKTIQEAVSKEDATIVTVEIQGRNPGKS